MLSKVCASLLLLLLLIVSALMLILATTTRDIAELHCTGEVYVCVHACMHGVQTCW